MSSLNSAPFDKHPRESKQEWLSCLVYCGMNPDSRRVIVALSEVFEDSEIEGKLAEKINEKYDWESRSKLWDQDKKARIEFELTGNDLRQTLRNHQLTKAIGTKLTFDYLDFCNSNPDRVDDSDYNTAAKTRLYLSQANSVESDLDFRLSGMQALLERYKDELEG